MLMSYSKLQKITTERKIFIWNEFFFDIILKRIMCWKKKNQRLLRESKKNSIRPTNVHINTLTVFPSLWASLGDFVNILSFIFLLRRIYHTFLYEPVRRRIQEKKWYINIQRSTFLQEFPQQILFHVFNIFYAEIIFQKFDGIEKNIFFNNT